MHVITVLSASFDPYSKLENTGTILDCIARIHDEARILDD